MAKTYAIGDKVNTYCIGTCPKDGYGLGKRHEHEVIEQAEQWGPGAVRIKCVDCGGTKLHNRPLTLSDDDEGQEDE